MNEQQLFLEALQREDFEQQQAFLDQACSGDAALRQRVEVLLSAHVRAGSFLNGPIAVPPIKLPQSERLGTIIGAYKLLQVIGEGGMGVVYMAEQKEPVERRVALKIIKPGMDSRQVVARFEAERQALAMMDHQNIARVFEAGTTESGHPFFVMELVRGVPITNYCDKKRLSVNERLELMIPVCQAIQHAHQKGIIHRDIKPTNVHVAQYDGRPVPKVIDFGIAKATAQKLTERTMFTELGQLVGTLEYMSPEQAELNQLDIDTRSDIYSLGVLLYELLTGSTPFDKHQLRTAAFAEMLRIIREDEPPKPSTNLSTSDTLPSIAANRQTEPARLSKAVRGELDWIVMKALDKDRSRRYETANAFAADIQRYLDDEAVLACPPSAGYRFGKFAGKHRAMLTTTALIVACLILGITVSAWQAVRATTAEAQANANAIQAQANSQETREKAQEANTQRDEAQRQRDEVKVINLKLLTIQEVLRRTLYAAHMNLAKNAWEAGGIVQVDELLVQHRPKPGEIDLRGFEWYYLYRLRHSDLFTLKGHTRNMPAAHAVAFSPDSKRLASASADDTVMVWDVQTGQQLLKIKGGGSNVAFSPNGKHVASGSGSWDDATNAYAPGQVKVWDAETGQEFQTFSGHTSSVHCVAYSPDGKWLASGGGEWDSKPGELKLWDAQSGEELRSLRGHTSDVFGVAFSPDGKRLASASDADEVMLWDVQTGLEILSLKDSGHSVTFSSDGTRLASGRRVWDAETGKELLSIKGDAQSLAFSPDGKRLASAAREVKVRDAQTGDELITYKGHTDWVTSVVFSPNGTRLASGSFDGTVKIWDATTGQEPRTFSGHIRSVRSVSFSPDGKRLAFGTSGTWDETKKVTVDAEVKVVDAHTGQELLAFKGHTGGVRSVVFSPDGKCLASGASDQTVKVWAAQTSLELLTLKGHTATVVSVVFSPDSTRLASSSSRPNGIGLSGYPGETGEVKVWDAQTGQELLNLKGHNRYVNSVTFSPDGKRLATLSRDKTVRVWNAQTGQEILSLNVLASHVGSVAFSPDGKLLASSNDPPSSHSSGAAKVWDAQTGEELLILKAHAPVTSVVFSPDSKRLVTGAGGQGPSSLGEVKVWDVLTGQELLTLDGRSGPSNDVAFSPDGHRLAGIGRDGAVKIWDATPVAAGPQLREKAP